MYEYLSEVVNIVDGDTIDVLIDLGFHVKIKQRVRLNGVDTPEKNSSNELERTAAHLVSSYVEKKLLGQTVYLSSYKSAHDKYGRFLADVYIDVDCDLPERCINDMLVKNKMGRVYDGSRKEDWTTNELNQVITMANALGAKANNIKEV